MPSSFLDCLSAVSTRLPAGKDPSAAHPKRRYPVAVLLTLAGCAAMGLRFGPSPVLPAFCYLAAVAVPLGFIDARHWRLPDVLTLPSYPAAIALLGSAAPFIPNGPVFLMHALIGCGTAVTLYLALSLVDGTGMGGGDVKLSGVLGLYLGWIGAPALVAGLLGAFVLAAAGGLALIVAGKATARSQLPFGPCMLAAAIAAILASPGL